MKCEIDLDPFVDEFGVCDGLELSRTLIAYAVSVIVPYADGCPGCTDSLFSAIANNTLATMHAVARAEGGLPGAILSEHEPGPLRRALEAGHIKASKPKIMSLIQQANALHDH